MISILVTGKDSQLAQCIDKLSSKYSNFKFIFKTSSELDITNSSLVNSCFRSFDNFDYCINCAAYTAVDKAETERAKAHIVNVKGVKNLAEACLKNQVKLIHISTDFVFDGRSLEAYSEHNPKNPMNIYGETKLKGEQAIENILEDYVIIRTSWLYSEYGNNFFKTMLALSKERNEISVVNDQIGSPTYAGDLAEAIFVLLGMKKVPPGIYHYCNFGVASWYDFASEIFKLNASNVKLSKIETKDYPTQALRPKYSALNTSKIKKTLGIEIPYWVLSLKRAYKNLLMNEE
jgi:dTDP-4-dehydrorhamnose reductase